MAYAHPAWMVERWASFYGLDAARAICRHGQTQPVLTLRIQAPAVEDELAAAGIHLEPGELLTPRAQSCPATSPPAQLFARAACASRMKARS